jgi:hypothetical protein
MTTGDCSFLKNYLGKGETTPEYDAHIEICEHCKTAIDKEFDKFSNVLAGIGEMIKDVKKEPVMVSFTKEEVKEIYNFVDSMSGGNPENGFAWDGTDDINDPTTSALVKIFKSVGRKIPENLEK